MLQIKLNNSRLRLFVYQCDICTVFEAYSPKLRIVCLAGRAHLLFSHRKEGIEVEVWEKDLINADAMFNSHAKVCRLCGGDGPECCDIGEKLLVLINDALNTGLCLEAKPATSIPRYWVQRMGDA